jgi:hypothetical protein
MDEDHAVTEISQRVEGPWLLLAYPANPVIRLDSRFLDRVMADDDELVLSVGDVTAYLKIVAGTAAASAIANALAAHTRSNTSGGERRSDRYEQPVECPNDGNAPAAAPLYFGDDAVRATDSVVTIGSFRCRTTDVQRYALASAELPHPHGLFPAALACLVLGSNRRNT